MISYHKSLNTVDTWYAVIQTKHVLLRRDDELLSLNRIASCAKLQMNGLSLSNCGDHLFCLFLCFCPICGSILRAEVGWLLAAAFSALGNRRSSCMLACSDARNACHHRVSNTTNTISIRHLSRQHAASTHRNVYRSQFLPSTPFSPPKPFRQRMYVMSCGVGVDT